MKKISKNKNIVLGIGLILISLLIIYTSLPKNKKISLQTVEAFYVEYGEEIDLSVENYIIMDNFTEKEIDELLKNIKVEVLDLDTIEIDDKTYPSLGEYQVNIIYKNKIQKTKIIIQDTIAPKFNDVSEISFIKGTTDYKYEEEIIAKDLQEISYDFQTKTVDVNNVGEYKILAIATDTSKNKTEKEIIVKVIENPTNIEEESNITSNQNNNTLSSNHNTTNGTSNSNNVSNNTNSTTNNSNNTGGSLNNSSNNENTTPPPVVNVPDFVAGAGGYFISENNVKMEQGIDYVFASLNAYDVYTYSPNSTPLSTVLRDGVTIYFCR